MSSNESGDGFAGAVEPILRKFVENIDSPFVWMPLGLFILCVLAYPVTHMRVFPYLGIAFLIIGFGADWVGRWQNRRTPPEPVPETTGNRNDLLEYLSKVQSKAVEMLDQGKTAAAQALTEKNLKAIDLALTTYPNDADFQALMGYTLKDLYQGSKNLLPTQLRQAYLKRARAFFERGLKLDPNNASAHNGMGNVLFFEGRFNDAIREHDVALKLTHGKYEAASHDRDLVLSVKNGESSFDY